MGLGNFISHIGTFFLLVSVALLIVTDISSPVVQNLPIMRVRLNNATAEHDTSMSFGTFGWCLIAAEDGNNYCSRSQLGYHPLRLLNNIDGTALNPNTDEVTFSEDNVGRINQAADDTTHALTKVMILHPIATGIVFIAFMLSLGSSMVGSFLASAVAFLAFLITAAAVISGFVLFNLVRSAVNDAGPDGRAYYSHGAWTLLAAGILTLLGSIILFFTCCSNRRHRRKEVVVKQPVVSDYGTPATHRRRRWGFGRRY